MAEPPRSIQWSRLIAEGAVIVVSILLAFGVDAWWDSRQERVREESYLGQIAEDLESTLENNATFGGRAESVDWAAARLVQSYYEATPPPRDSVAHWLSLMDYWVVQPRLGTLQMLVSTGDLRVIRSDSLRTAIPTYLADMIAFEGFEAEGAHTYQQAARDLAAYIDRNQIRIEMLSPTARDSILRSIPDPVGRPGEHGPMTPFPLGPTRDLPRQDLQKVIRNPEVHRILAQILEAKQEMGRNRDRMRRATENLLEKVRSARAR